MSLASRVMARKAAGDVFDFQARRDRLRAAEAARADAVQDDADADAADGDLSAPAPATSRPRRPSPAQASVLRKQAAAASDEVADGSADLSPYDQQLVRLYSDIKRLKSVQETSRKIEIKRQILPDYAPWVLGRLEAVAAGQRGVQDDVMVQVMIWSIDTGDYRLALELAEYCRRWSSRLPDRFKRDLANTVTEEIADQALRAFRAGGDEAAAFPGGILGDVEELFREDDMFDVVRAKLQKAIGLAILQALPEDLDLTAKVAAWRDALAFFKRAQAKDAAAGCVKLIEKLERDIAKHDKPEGAAPPPA